MKRRVKEGVIAAASALPPIVDRLLVDLYEPNEINHALTAISMVFLTKLLFSTRGRIKL